LLKGGSPAQPDRIAAGVDLPGDHDFTDSCFSKGHYHGRPPTNQDALPAVLRDAHVVRLADGKLADRLNDEVRTVAPGYAALI